jgi:hypothetical protein
MAGLAGVISLACAAPPNPRAPAGWTFAGVPAQRDAVFHAESDGTIRLVADTAVGFLLRPLATPPNGDARLGWRWRVSAQPAPVPPDRIGRDDRPAAVHVVFAEARGGGGILADLRRWLRGAAVHEAFAGRTITYMWGGTLPAGTRLPNPYLPDDGWIIILRGPEAPTGVWFSERIDPVADYTALFGAPAARPTHLALSADTEDSGGCAIAHIEPPSFLAARGTSP